MLSLAAHPVTRHPKKCEAVPRTCATRRARPDRESPTQILKVESGEGRRKSYLANEYCELLPTPW